MNISEQSKQHSSFKPSVDNAQFEVLYTQYVKKVYNYIFFRINNPHVADDLTSQVFLKVFEKIHTYNYEKSCFATWLFTIANNVTIDYFRKAGKTQHIYLDENIILLTTDSMDTEQCILTQEENKQLIQALSQLNDLQKNIISLKFWGRFNNREIAKLTNLSESNVGVVLYRSLKKLRKILKQVKK